MSHNLTDEELNSLAVAISDATGQRHSLIDPRYAEEPHRALVQQHMSWQQKYLDMRYPISGGNTRILFGISSDLECQAHVSIFRQTPCIAFSYGLVTRIGVFFNLLLRDASMLTHVGDTSQEVAPSMTPEEINIAPIDPERRLYCSLLQSVTYRFVMSHELAHLMSGHLFIRVGGQPSLTMRERLRTTDQAMISQVLEFDADEGALWDAGTELVDWVAALTPADPSPRDKDLAIEKATYIWLLSVYCSFRLFADGTAVPPVRTASHPRLMHRMIALYVKMNAQLSNQNLAAAENMLSMQFNQAILDGKRAFNRFGVKPVPVETTEDQEFLSLENYLPALNDAWLKIRSQIFPIALPQRPIPIQILDPLEVAKIGGRLKY